MINNAMAALSREDENQPNTPLSVCVAMSQAYIGYDLQNALREELRKRGFMRTPVVTVVTQVRVDENDPAFQNPSKPIGHFMTKEQAEHAEKAYGYVMKEDAGRGYRRVVASPKPVEIVEQDAINSLVDANKIVICCGGGGIPVTLQGDHLKGASAVIDKDFASCLLAKELDADSWKQVNELRKTDPKAADELVRTFSYHIDHGYGMDCYAVGPTLGAGVSALMVNDTIIYPWCYKTQEVLDNGPLRFTVKLEFNPLAVKGDTAVVETRLITLDAGSHLNRTAVSYSNLKESLPIVTGIVLHEPDGAVVADAAGGYMTYVDPTTGPDNGKIFMGAAFPAVVKEAKTVLFPIEEKKMRNNADGHVLVVSDYEPGADYVYYWGFAWDRADIKTAEAWNRYMADFAQKVRNPMTVSIR